MVGSHAMTCPCNYCVVPAKLLPTWQRRIRFPKPLLTSEHASVNHATESACLTSYVTSYENALPTTTCQGAPNFLSIWSLIICKQWQ